VLLDLESQTSALGHVGLLKWQRNDLRKQLQQQKSLRDVEKQKASNLRRLTLRLAAQIAVKESHLRFQTDALLNVRTVGYECTRRNEKLIKDLEEKLYDDVARANILLRTLEGRSDGGSSMLPIVYFEQY
jgi:hypothetical protein